VGKPTPFFILTIDFSSDMIIGIERNGGIVLMVETVDIIRAVDCCMSWFIYLYIACFIIGAAWIIRKTIKEGPEKENW